MNLNRQFSSALLILAIVLLASLVILVPQAFAHEGEHEETAAGSYETPIYIDNMGTIVEYAAVAFLALILISVLFKKKLKDAHKKILFILIALLVISVTAYLVIGSIYLNVVSETKGPIHWHADFEIWICEEEINLKDPKPPLSVLGSPLLHEHNDNRMHVEGVVLQKEDVSLGAFFHVIGGKLSEEQIIVPTNEGIVEKKNGELCNGKPAKLYVFVNGELLPSEEYPSYMIQPYETVPPGDTIKVIFSSLPLEEINPYIKGYGRERRI